jgi:hypothetical protein
MDQFRYIFDYYHIKYIEYSGMFTFIDIKESWHFCENPFDPCISETKLYLWLEELFNRYYKP